MEFRLLGRFEAEHDGAPVAVGRRRERCLLALLLLQANTAAAVTRLVELLWDDEPPLDPRATLHTYVARLRTRLEPGGKNVYGVRLARAGDGYLAEVDPDAVDALRFRALATRARTLDDPAERAALLREALRLWRGPMLADIASDRLRARLAAPWQETQLTATEAAIEAEMALGHGDEAISELRVLLDEHPHRERFTGLLMLALYRAGRRAEALEAYRSVRRALIDQLGVEPGNELRELQQRILAGDTNLLIPPPGVHEAAAAVPARAVPRQLPAAPQYFTGRRAELDTLTSLLERTSAIGGTVVISAIDGMAGIGKTALAVHAAHRLSEKFPDGQLFLDLHGYTKGYQPRSPHEALDTFLRALGVPPQQIPQEAHERAALYRQRLADTRTLIVLDNAADESQVRLLLPGSAACLVLVTSRRRLKALDDAVTLSLDVLPEADARTLLRTVAGPDRVQAEDPQLEQITRLCGRLPLALRIAAALLRHRPSWSLRHLADKLSVGQVGLSGFHDTGRDLKAVFDLSYRSLSDTQQRLFRRLGLMPGPDTDAYAGAALLETDPARAEDLLQELTDHNLLTEPTPGRYRMHDLLRAHARTLATEEPADPRERALKRLFEYYQHTAGRASVAIARFPRTEPSVPAPAYAPAVDDPERASAWLRNERANLLAAFSHAADQGWDEQTTALGAGLAELLRIEGPWPLAVTVHQTAAAAADRCADRLRTAHALTELGRARSLIDEHVGALDALTQALEIYQEHADHIGQANALIGIGRARYANGDNIGAANAATEALNIYRAHGNRFGQVNALTQLGTVRRLMGDFPGAGDALVESLELARALGDRLGQAHALTQMGTVRRLTGDYRAACDALTESRDLHLALGNRHGQAYALADLGYVRQLTGEFPEATDALTQALDIFRDLGDRVGQANAHAALGLVLRASGDLPAAADALALSLQIDRAIGHRVNEAWALNYYAAVIADTGDLTAALALYRDALRINRELRKPDGEALALEGVGECLIRSGDVTGGTAQLRQALEDFTRLGMHPDIARVSDRLADVAGNLSRMNPGETPIQGQ